MLSNRNATKLLRLGFQRKTLPPHEVGIVPDAFSPTIGPLGGIYTGALWAKSCTKNVCDSWLLTAPVDGPFFPRDFVERVKSGQPLTQPIIARFGGDIYPVCGLWPYRKLMIAELHGRQSGNAIRPVLSALGAQEFDFATFYQQNPFANANHVVELLQLQARMKLKA